MRYKVLLATSGQPALNPRIVKEADALADAGYEVTVVYAYWNDWGEKFSKELFASKKWLAIRAGGTPANKRLTYIIDRLRYKVFRWCFTTFGLFTNSIITRGAWSLIKEVKKHKADLYIGHNLGALSAVVKAAKKHRAKCGFDIEDLHRFEVNDDTNSLNYKIACRVEDKYIKELDYLTVSSPQTADAYRRFYPWADPVIILNVFPNFNRVNKPVISTGPLKLFWFSQTTGRNRGIEDIVNALNELDPAAFELHLLGNADESNKEYFRGIASYPENIYFHQPVLPDEVFGVASQFDVGLALEPGFSGNNRSALSNKLFTYLQAGLAIIVSDTPAQRSFMDTYEGVGSTYPIGNITALAAILTAWYNNRNDVYNRCQTSYRLGHDELNWENESLKFLSLVNKTLTIE